MKIFIDADGCPVVDAAVRIAKKRSIECTIICDTSHSIQRDGASTIIVDKGADSADFRLVNLSKQATVINQDGKHYTEENISGLLEFRAVSAKIRRNGGRTKGLSKRTQQQNRDFENAFLELLDTHK